MLEVRNLRVRVGGKEIVRGVSFSIPKGEVHFLLGPNGSGKSTLVNAIAGKPGYTVSGQVKVNGRNLLKMKAWERSRYVFVGFQHPPEIPGVKIRELGVDVTSVGLSVDFLEREMVGLSGGEKKKMEIAQMLTREPPFVILDEPDSGVDVDSLAIIGNALRKYHQAKKPGMLIITHRAHISRFIQPSRVYVMKDGKIVCRGDRRIVEELERVGFGGVLHERCD